MENPEYPFDENLIPPDEREEFLRSYSSLSPEEKKQIDEAFEAGHMQGKGAQEKRIQEVVESEIEEWSKKIEEAETAEARKQIIRSIIISAEVERFIGGISQGTSHSEESKKLINQIREKNGLPPKYPEELK